MHALLELAFWATITMIALDFLDALWTGPSRHARREADRRYHERRAAERRSAERAEEMKREIEERKQRHRELIEWVNARQESLRADGPSRHTPR